MVDAGVGSSTSAKRCKAQSCAELNEELGVIATLGQLVGVDSHADERVLVVVYEATLDGEPRAGDEVLEVRMFARDELPWDELASLDRRGRAARPPRLTTAWRSGRRHGTLEGTMTAATPHPHVSDAVTVTRSAPAR